MIRKVREQMPQLIEVEYLVCDSCHCDMENTGVVLTSFPAQYQYRCPTCGKIINSFTKYANKVNRYGW